MLSPTLLRDATPYPPASASPAGWIVEPSSFMVRLAAELAVFRGRLMPLPPVKGVRRFLCLSPECQCERTGTDCLPGEHGDGDVKYPPSP